MSKTGCNLKACSDNHNLNIQMYSFKELLNLFDIESSHKITAEDMKRAKMKVLMTHPDKSRLPSEYFLFYKKAFDVVLEFYTTQSKESREITEENTKYSVLPNTEYDKNTHRKINSTIKEMKSDVFNQKFNQLFDQNMSVSKDRDESRNGWFKEETAQYAPDAANKNVNSGIDRVKQLQTDRNQGMTIHRGVQNLNSGAGVGIGNLYDDDDDESDGTNSQYITSDPFSKLKYDDLRKVHKDETVFSVSERDLDKMPKYASVDQFTKERNQMALAPLEKQEAQRILAEQERQHAERVSRKEYEAKLQSMKYAEKNKSVLASFLHLGN